MKQSYGELVDAKGFADAFDRWLTMMYRDGMAATVRRYLEAD